MGLAYRVVDDSVEADLFVFRRRVRHDRKLNDPRLELLKTLGKRVGFDPLLQVVLLLLCNDL